MGLIGVVTIAADLDDASRRQSR
ncbi:hypothetical protein PPSIR1_31163 [Plesiocystis pacifica SIR-1]|uniref:Uncharacterized protein n=1 Tax=Plesiocystis pacifica SIR-1 TaxID=391625 RepID=A6GHN4_9BACT|nr:hypothetical protein PPSIR1_31163 [Plesiocystis pacifica SIR-1]